jgi:hypothetical protein
VTRACTPPNGSASRHSAESFVALYSAGDMAARAKSCVARTGIGIPGPVRLGDLKLH